MAALTPADLTAARKARAAERKARARAIHRMHRGAELWRAASAAAEAGDCAAAARRYRAAAKLYRALPGMESMADECAFRAGRYQDHADYARYTRQFDADR